MNGVAHTIFNTGGIIDCVITCILIEIIANIGG